MYNHKIARPYSAPTPNVGGRAVSVRIILGDCRAILATLPDESVNCVVTSPPYFGLRDYGVDGQIGLEPTPDAFVAEMVSVFRDVRCVLRKDGTLWLNLGDSYVSSPPGNKKPLNDVDGAYSRRMALQVGHGEDREAIWACGLSTGLPHKSLIGMPWRVAFALQADGWILRQDIIWAKPNPMPESVRDRCTKSHEYVFLLSKSARYHYDADAIRQPVAPASVARLAQDIEAQEGSHRVPGKTNGTMKAVRPRANGSTLSGGDYGRHHLGTAIPEKERRQRGHERSHDGFDGDWDQRTKAEQQANGANCRSVWNIATQPFSEAHFATFPPELAERCIKAGCPKGGTVLDPFGGAGTTGLVADRLQRNAILIELNPEYAAMARHRVLADAGMFGDVV